MSVAIRLSARICPEALNSSAPVIQVAICYALISACPRLHISDDDFLEHRECAEDLESLLPLEVQLDNQAKIN